MSNECYTEQCFYDDTAGYASHYENRIEFQWGDTDSCTGVTESLQRIDSVIKEKSISIRQMKSSDVEQAAY